MLGALERLISGTNSRREVLLHCRLSTVWIPHLSSGWIPHLAPQTQNKLLLSVFPVCVREKRSLKKKKRKKGRKSVRGKGHFVVRGWQFGFALCHTKLATEIRMLSGYCRLLAV